MTGRLANVASSRTAVSMLEENVLAPRSLPSARPQTVKTWPRRRLAKGIPVFRFAEQARAERLMQEFGREAVHPSEQGKGKRRAQWKKRTYKTEARNLYDFRKDATQLMM